MNITSRLFSDEQDLHLLKQFITDLWSDGSDHHYFHLGDLIWQIYQNTIFDPYQNIRIWQNDAGQLLGFAMFDVTRTAFSAAFQVHPRHHENNTLYDAMVHWIDERTHETENSDDPVWSAPGRDTIWTGAYEDDVALSHALERHGFVRGEVSMLHMSQSLNYSIDIPILPAGWQVRHVAGEHEFEERAAIHRDVWHPSRVTLESYQRMRTIPGYTPELDLVAVSPTGTFASYCICWLDATNKCGEFEPVGTRAAFRGQRIGKAVMLEGLRRLQARGATTVIVATNYGNEAAIKLYESVGFRIVAREYAYSRSL